jgi:hypothetical protein
MTRTRLVVLLVVALAWPAVTTAAPAATKRAPAAVAKRGPIVAKPTVLPFIADDYTKAVAAARAREVPLFIEAWAPW